MVIKIQINYLVKNIPIYLMPILIPIPIQDLFQYHQSLLLLMEHLMDC